MIHELGIGIGSHRLVFFTFSVAVFRGIVPALTRRLGYVVDKNYR